MEASLERIAFGGATSFGAGAPGSIAGSLMIELNLEVLFYKAEAIRGLGFRRCKHPYYHPLPRIPI